MEGDLVSESNNSLLINIIASVVLFCLSLIFFSMAIVEVYWIGLAGGLIPLITILVNISKYYKNIYYFKEDQVVVADFKNNFIDELNLDESVTWNEYLEYQRSTKRNFLIICDNYKSIVIDSHDYKNYGEMLKYMTSKSLIKNTKLTPYSASSQIVSPLGEQIPIWILCTIMVIILSFWLITSSKKQTNEVKYFTGYIKSIEHSRKNKNIKIKLSNVPNLSFEFKNSKDIDFFDSYNYNDGENSYVNLNKYIEVGVSKDDYDWKIQNKIINKIDLNSIPYLDVKEYKISK